MNPPKHPAPWPFHPSEVLDLGDLEAVRLVLRGDSSVDWHRLNFKGAEEVDQFLRVLLLDPQSPQDDHRMRVIHDQAVNYLKGQFGIKLPDDLAKPESIQSLFLHASYPKARLNRRRRLSCMLLKVMSIIHHVEARALVFKTPMSHADIFGLVEGRIDALRDSLRLVDAPVIDVYGSRKGQESLISKLLSKKETFAAAVFDKLRYRVVVREESDLLPVLAHLIRTFIPFNYVVPGQSFNNLLDVRPVVASREDLRSRIDGIVSNYPLAGSWGYRDTRSNEFSGSGYRMINLIADLPLRLDAFLSPDQIIRGGRVGFALIEVQVVDERTEKRNESGENSHVAYKERRKDRVLERLRMGSRMQPRDGSAAEE